MKFAAIWNLLVEKHGIEPQMKTRVRNYFYTNAKDSPCADSFPETPGTTELKVACVSCNGK